MSLFLVLSHIHININIANFPIELIGYVCLRNFLSSWFLSPVTHIYHLGYKDDSFDVQVTVDRDKFL